MVMDPYLLQRAFHHALCSLDSTIFKSIDFVLVTDQCANDNVSDGGTCFLTKCIVAATISRLDSDSSNDRKSGIIQRGYYIQPIQTTIISRYG
jgi:hypothetical protein